MEYYAYEQCRRDPPLQPVKKVRTWDAAIARPLRDLMLQLNERRPFWTYLLEEAADSVEFDPDLPFCGLYVQDEDSGTVEVVYFSSPYIVKDYALGRDYACIFGTTLLEIGQGRGIKVSVERQVVREWILDNEVTDKKPSARELADTTGVKKTVCAEELKKWRDAKKVVSYD